MESVDFRSVRYKKTKMFGEDMEEIDEFESEFVFKGSLGNYDG